ASAYRQRIKSPVEFVVGLLRSLRDETQTELLKVSIPVPMEGLGQTLFAPPNVKGWDGGQAWLNSATLLARHNLAWRFVQGPQGPYGAKINPAGSALKYGDRKDYGKQVDLLLDLLLQAQKDTSDAQARQKLVAF